MDRPEVKQESKKGFVPPRTDIERIIASVWCNILHLEKIGIYDNFFDLGDSLLATRVVNRLREHLGIDIPLSRMFENPTIYSLANFIETLKRAGCDNEKQVGVTTQGRESGEL